MYDPRRVVEGYLGGYLTCILDVWLYVPDVSDPVHLGVEAHRSPVGSGPGVGKADDFAGGVRHLTADIRSEESRTVNGLLPAGDRPQGRKSRERFGSRRTVGKIRCLSSLDRLENPEGWCVTGVPSPPGEPVEGTLYSWVRLVQEAQEDDVPLIGGEVRFVGFTGPAASEPGGVASADGEVRLRWHRIWEGSRRAGKRCPRWHGQARPQVADDIADAESNIGLQPRIVGRIP